MVFTDCSFVNNTAGALPSYQGKSRGVGGSGGGLSVVGGGELTVQGCEFHGNNASASGGGLMVSPTSVSLTMSDTRFAGNHAETAAQFAMDSGGDMAWLNVTVALSPGVSQVCIRDLQTRLRCRRGGCAVSLPVYPCAITGAFSV